MKKFLYAALFAVLPFIAVAAPAKKSEPYTTSALVKYKRLDNDKCTTRKECDYMIRDLIDTIPYVEESDSQAESDSFLLMINDGRLLDADVIKSIVDASKIIKVISVKIPAPATTAETKDPYAGMSKADIKRAYDDYYRENPDLTPPKWKFSD